MCMGACMLWCGCVAQRTTCRGQWSSSTMWVLRGGQSSSGCQPSWPASIPFRPPSYIFECLYISNFDAYLYKQWVSLNILSCNSANFNGKRYFPKLWKQKWESRAIHSQIHIFIEWVPMSPSLPLQTWIVCSQASRVHSLHQWLAYTQRTPWRGKMGRSEVEILKRIFLEFHLFNCFSLSDGNNLTGSRIS